MTWTCRLSREAEKQLHRLPRDRQQQIARAIDTMQHAPLVEDVQPIKSGSFQGAFRKRVGQYRIIFAVDSTAHVVDIAAILTRGEGTYR